MGILARLFGRKTRVRPLGDRVLVKVLEADERSEGGIYLPDQARRRSCNGDVVAVGPGILGDDGKWIKDKLPREGDRVLFSRFGGKELEIDGEHYLLLEREDILAVL